MNKIRNKADKDLSLGACMDKAFTKLNMDAETQALMRFKVADEIELDYAASVCVLVVCKNEGEGGRGRERGAHAH
jgi:hypothetical protein